MKVWLLLRWRQGASQRVLGEVEEGTIFAQCGVPHGTLAFCGIIS